jgi:hypothetical protein
LFYEYSVTKNGELKKKLDALCYIHPLALVDVPFCKENNIYYRTFEISAVPLPPE